MRGAFAFTVYNPVSAALLARYENIEARVLRGSSSILAVSSGGLWLRDTDANGQIVVHALRSAKQGVQLYDAILFYYNSNDQFIKRIEASFAYLEHGYWMLQKAVVSYPDRAWKGVV